MAICQRNNLIYKILRESNIHGCKLVVQRKRHISERICWVLLILLSIWLVVSTCFIQWQRFLQKRIAFTIQTNYRNWKFGLIGVTVCSNFMDELAGERIVQRYWNISSTDSKFEYYSQFIRTISGTRYFNLYEFKQYAEDASLNNVDMLDVAVEMRDTIQLSRKYGYKKVITEMGLCYSTTNLQLFQNPYKNRQIDLKIDKDFSCTAFENFCRIAVAPHILDTDNVTIFLHNKNEVISGADTLREELYSRPSTIITVIQIRQVIAVKLLRYLPPDVRKCMYFSHDRTEYFNMYTFNLCKISCRISAALQFCGCIPFFYRIAENVPICNASGLYCLSNYNWYDVPCQCYPNCNEIYYKQLYRRRFFLGSYARLVYVGLDISKTRVKRDVQFTLDELAVSFGGAAALFLGCSLISFVEILFFIFEWMVVLLCRKLMKIKRYIPTN